MWGKKKNGGEENIDLKRRIEELSRRENARDATEGSEENGEREQRGERQGEREGGGEKEGGGEEEEYREEGGDGGGTRGQRRSDEPNGENKRNQEIRGQKGKGEIDEEEGREEGGVESGVHDQCIVRGSEEDTLSSANYCDTFSVNSLSDTPSTHQLQVEVEVEDDESLPTLYPPFPVLLSLRSVGTSAMNQVRKRELRVRVRKREGEGE